MEELLNAIAACELCKGNLPFPPRPVLRVAPESRILIIGQAPGTKVHNTGLPWNDPSGDELRRWLDVSRDEFYDTSLFSIMPMGFCYPGKGRSGDNPPRKECAPQWHLKVLNELGSIKMVLLVGSYSIRYYLGEKRGKSVAETVASFESFLPRFFPLVHPSPRNRKWMKDNLWFSEEVIPRLREETEKILRDTGRKK